MRDILQESREAEKSERQAGQQRQGEQRESQETTETGEWRKQGEQGGKGMETNGTKETVDEDWTEESTDRERKGDWGHLYGPECCPACQQNSFECGCLDVSFESKGEKGGSRDRRMRCVREKENGNLGHGDREFWCKGLVSGSMVGVQWSLGGVKVEEDGSAGEERSRMREPRREKQRK